MIVSRETERGKEKMITKNDIIEKVKTLGNDASYFIYRRFPEFNNTPDIGITIFYLKRINEDGTVIPRKLNNFQAIENFITWLENNADCSIEDKFYYVYKFGEMVVHLEYV